jgi:hypothetical protein
MSGVNKKIPRIPLLLAKKKDPSPESEWGLWYEAESRSAQVFFEALGGGGGGGRSLLGGGDWPAGAGAVLAGGGA